jgi:hypothetical protein
MGTLILLVVVATTVWVGVDAHGRRWPKGTLARSTGGWIFGCLALWIVVLPFYLAQRGRAPKDHGGTLPLRSSSADAVAQTSVAPPSASVAPPRSTQ